MEILEKMKKVVYAYKNSFMYLPRKTVSNEIKKPIFFLAVEYDKK